MASRYSIIFSFILATLLATGSVNLLYNSLGKILTTNSAPHDSMKRTPQSSLSQTDQKQATQTRKVSPAKDYTIITRRILFGKTADTTAGSTAKPQPILTTTSLDLILLGTIGGTADAQRAIIRLRKSGKGAIYSAGDTIENAVIKEINRSQIILTVNGADEVLLMEEMKSPPSTGTAKKYPMPKGYIPPNKRVAKDTDITDDFTETDEDTEITEQLAPTTIPKRRMTLKPKKQQVVEQ